MAFHAVIFDLDGTLLETLQDIADAMNNVLSKHGLQTRDLDTYRRFVGNGMRALVERILPREKQDKKLIEMCVEEYKTESSRGIYSKTKPYDGITETLDGLTSNMIRIAVLSNKSHELTLKNLKNYLPDFRFDYILGQQDGFPLKPDPSGALRIAESFEIKPEKTLFIGDTEVDMKTALAANMFPVGVLWGFRSEEELKKNGAKLLVKKPTEILDLFK